MITIPGGPTIYSKDELVAMGYGGYAGWSDPGAGQDFAATGGGGKFTGATSPGATGSSGGAFNFDWEQAERDQMEKLRPYYEQKLAENNYDIGKTIQSIEEDYIRGNRYRSEDQATAQRGFDITEPREKNELLTNLNRRGMLQSTVRNEEEQFLDETQQRRREAIDRALTRQGETAGIERQRGIDEVNLKGDRYARDLNEEKKQRALALATDKYDRDYSRFITEVGRFQ